MQLSKQLTVFCTLFLASFGAAVAQTSRPLKVDDLFEIRRLGDPHLSSDGETIAFTVTVSDKAANRTRTQIYTIATSGGEPKQLTVGSTSALSPRWSPDGRRLAFVTSGQVWTMDADGGSRNQVTRISTSTFGPLVWSPDGRFIAFNSDVYPECQNDDCNRRRVQMEESNKVKAHTVTNRLLFRHWNEWRDNTRTHVFIVPADGGPAIDVTPGDFDSPPYAAGTGVDFAFAPDSKEIAFLRNPDKEEATSTNSDIFIVPVGGGEAKNITAQNRGYDLGPNYTRDGKYIIYRSQTTAGFESDRWRLMAYDRSTGASTEIVRNFDLHVEELALSGEGKYIYFTAFERGRLGVYRVPLGGGEPERVLRNVFATNLRMTPNGKSLIFLNSSLAMPTEIYRADLESGRLNQVTNVNKALVAGVSLSDAEEIEWIGAQGKRIHGFILKPAGFDRQKKYPLLVLIHGGPQAAWSDSWSYRWNPQIFTAAGYVVFMPNPRGSIGYGQQFVNEVTGDWAGKAYEDIMNGVAFVLNQGLADKNRVGAAGASYGGYMVTWIEGHNDDPRFKFSVLVAHAPFFNLSSLYSSTDELWFVDWEFKGSPWDTPEMYARWSPNMFVKNFKTPLLVTHGELDYRVPFDQSLQLFTALQKMRVDSKLLLYPDEGHWILKPQNSELWYKTVISWCDRYLKP